jgi:hypothetical protein
MHQTMGTPVLYHTQASHILICCRWQITQMPNLSTTMATVLQCIMTMEYHTRKRMCYHTSHSKYTVQYYRLQKNWFSLFLTWHVNLKPVPFIEQTKNKNIIFHIGNYIEYVIHLYISGFMPYYWYPHLYPWSFTMTGTTLVEKTSLLHTMNYTKTVIMKRGKIRAKNL